MKGVSSFVGITGAVLLCFGIVGGLAAGDFSISLIATHLVGGIVFLVFWLVTSGAGHLGNAGEVVLGRGARFGYSAIAYILVFVALLVAVNWIATKKNHRWDLTNEGVYSLSQQSSSLVQGLKKPLKLVAFKGQENTPDDEFERLFSLYKYANSTKVSYEVIDPRTKPFLVEQYEMKPGNLAYVQYGEDSDEKKGVSRLNEFSEQSLTNSILKLTRGEAKKIYVVQGHQEPSLADANPAGLKSLADAIKDENLSVEGIFLGEKSAVPEDASAVLLVSPQRAIPQAEKDLLITYAQNGGRLLLFTDPQRPHDVSEIAEKFGITINNDVIVDLVQRLFGPAALGAEIVSRQYSPAHPITKNLTAENISIFNIASSLQFKADASDTAKTYTELVKSGPKSWAERNLTALFNSDHPSADFNETEDLKGPVTVAIAYEHKAGNEGTSAAESDPKFEKVGRVVAFGDSDFITNGLINEYANRDLILNAINWSVGEEGGLTIRPRSIKASVAPITHDQFVIILSSSFLLPEVILILGLLIWWRRKSALV